MKWLALAVLQQDLEDRKVPQSVQASAKYGLVLKTVPDSSTLLVPCPNFVQNSGHDQHPSRSDEHYHVVFFDFLFELSTLVFFQPPLEESLKDWQQIEAKACHNEGETDLPQRQVDHHEALIEQIVGQSLRSINHEPLKVVRSEVEGQSLDHSLRKEAERVDEGRVERDHGETGRLGHHFVFVSQVDK